MESTKDLSSTYIENVFERCKNCSCPFYHNEFLDCVLKIDGAIPADDNGFAERLIDLTRKQKMDLSCARYVLASKGYCLNVLENDTDKRVRVMAKQKMAQLKGK